MDDDAQKLYTFHTPWGLYRYGTWVMGVSSASGETHDCLRKILNGLEGVIQIKDDLLVGGKGT